MGITLRRANGSDARLLAETRRLVWEETYRGIYPDKMLDEYDLESYTRRDRQRIETPGHFYYLFLDGETCVGYFSYGPYNYGTYKDFDLCLNNLYIRRAYQGQGLGKQAFAHLRGYCAEQGISKFFCGCNVHNRKARSFYTHMGGQIGDEADGHENPSDDIIHFEFHIGESL